MEYTLREIDKDLLAMQNVIRARYTEWGELLSSNEFSERETVLANTSWAKSGLITWGLFKGNCLVASCETFSTSAMNQGKYFVGTALASVVVPACHRRKGFASILLEKLMNLISTETDFACLFSEVGTNIYEKCGFTILPQLKLTIDTATIQNEQYLESRFLVHEEAIALWQVSLNTMRNPSIMPNSDQLLWNWERSQFYANALNRKPSAFVGIKSATALILFACDFKNKTLKILHANRSLIACDAEWISIWSELLTFAKSHQLESITAWIPQRLTAELLLIKDTFSGRVEEDKENVPMINFINLPKMEYQMEYQCWV